MLRNTCFLKQIYLFSLSLSLVTRDVLMKQHANITKWHRSTEYPNLEIWLSLKDVQILGSNDQSTKT